MTEGRDNSGLEKGGQVATGGAGWGRHIRTIFILATASFLVGAVLTFAGISPIELWENLARGVFNLAQGFLESGWEYVRTALIYIAVGAIVVVPVWFVLRIFGSRK